jgi:hypothetical protein
MDRKKNTAFLRLNTKIYKVNKILKVAQSFAKVCWVNVNGDANGIIQVSLKPRSENTDIKKVGYEFFNHVLAEMKLSEDS